MRPWLAVCSLLLVLALAGSARAAFDPNDSFDGGVIDTTKWQVRIDQGTSLTETGGKLVLTQGPTDLGHDVTARLNSTYRLRGAFDIQVDYALIQWPAENQVAIQLCASPWPKDSNALQRISWPGTGESYSATFHAWTNFNPVVVSTTDMAGKLRLVRDASNVLSGYAWQESTQQWVLLDAEPVSGDDCVVALQCLGDAHAPMTASFDNFRVNSGQVVFIAPTITDVQIDRGRDADWWDWSYWHTRYVVQVQGSVDEQPAQLWLQDMQGLRQVIATDGDHWYDPAGTNPGGSWEDARVTAGPNYTYTYVWYEARQALPIPAGSYTLTVVGNAGSQTSLTTAVLPAVPDAVPTLTGPADQSVTETAAPTFQWLPLSGTKGILQVRAEGDTTYTSLGPEQDDCGQIWLVPISPTGPASAVYDFDGKGPALDPGRTYFWQVDDWTPVDDRVSDPRVSIWNSQTSHHRFTLDTTWPALPALPGKLAYEQTLYGDGNDPYNLQAILQYGTSPAERKWVGPDGSHTPSYSWDGSKIAYRVSDWGIRVANADGSDSVRLLGNWDWDSADFSPDATWITYSDGEYQGSDPQHVFIQKLFETTRTLLVRSRGKRASRPRWSPDGKWIAYLSCCDPSGNNLWLIHPDGTQDHPVVPTTLAGYSGWTVTWLGSSVGWSPDAMRVGVNFSAKSPDGSTSLDGIGVLSKDGGEVTPVFLNPEGHVCCALATFFCWSPDGQSLVFSSSHQLPVDPNWANGGIVPGMELWMKNADGTGEPVRLTYDYSYVGSAAWWAPNTPTGSDISVTKGDATVTFDTVSTEGSTAACVTSDAPGPAPEGYQLLGDCWELLTTAAHTGNTSVTVQYRDVTVPTGAESTVRLLAWEDGSWRNITRTLDADGCSVTGRAPAFSHFTLALAQQRFSDVPTDFWAFGAVNACVDAGLVKGYPDGSYAPSASVTRDQMAVFISRALAGGDALVPTAPATASFPDVDPSYWAFKYIEYVKIRNIVGGYPDGLYHPADPVDRGQMAIFVSRATVNPTGDAGLSGYTPPATPSFPDVGTDYYAYKYIEYIKGKGVAGGYPDGTYQPSVVVSRDQMAVYLQRAFELPL